MVRGGGVSEPSDLRLGTHVGFRRRVHKAWQAKLTPLNPFRAPKSSPVLVLSNFPLKWVSSHEGVAAVGVPQLGGGVPEQYDRLIGGSPS